MKTKILSFILFAILLIFTSCGDGTTNSGNSDINDNPQLDGDIDDNKGKGIGDRAYAPHKFSFFVQRLVTFVK